MIDQQLYELTPTVNFVSRSFTEAGTVWGPRLIPDCQFFYVVTGEAALQLGPDMYSVRPGAMVFFGADSPHRLSTIKPTDYVSLHFSWHHSSPESMHPAYGIQSVSNSDLSLKAQSYRLSVPGQKEIAIPHHLYVPNIEPLLMRMVAEYSREHPAGSYLLRSLMMEFLTLVLRSLMNLKDSRTPDKINNALHAMREQPEKNWSVAELAALCSYHSSYFTRLFRDQVGQNPKSYLVSERIRQAKQALLNGEKLESIAERLGYISIHYFSRNFKKETGLTPSEFRQQGNSRYE